MVIDSSLTRYATMLDIPSTFFEDFSYMFMCVFVLKGAESEKGESGTERSSGEVFRLLVHTPHGLNS